MPEAAPTMIIPSGTSIEVDQHGQLSVRTPGNLVLQNSGNYGTIESTNGSIRIEPDVQVEAVNVRCSKICYVQGSLTAWKVEAEAIQLEESARAHIILQETRSLQVGKEARLVGNFSSEKELFLLFSRFANQMRSLPFGRRDDPEPSEMSAGGEALRHLMNAGGAEEAQQRTQRRLSEAPQPTDVVVDAESSASQGTAGASTIEQLPDTLFYAQVLLERESHKVGAGPNTQNVVQELLGMLRDGQVARLGQTHQGLFNDVVRPSADLKRAMGMIATHFGTQVEVP